MKDLKTKLKRTYLKLLKAHASHKMDKAMMLYQKVLRLQLEMKKNESKSD